MIAHWQEIAFWTCTMMAGFCVIGCLLFGVAWLFARPLAWIVDFLDTIDAEGRER